MKREQLALDQIKTLSNDQDEIPGILYALQNQYCEDTDREINHMILNARLHPVLYLQNSRPGMLRGQISAQRAVHKALYLLSDRARIRAELWQSTLNSPVHFRRRVPRLHSGHRSLNYEVV